MNSTARSSDHCHLRRRLPGWRITRYAPLGWSRPIRADGGLPAEPLGDHTGSRIAELSAAADLTVVSPSFPLGEDEIRLAALYGAAEAPWARFFTNGLGQEAHPVVPAGVRVAGEVDMLRYAPMMSVRAQESAKQAPAADYDEHELRVS